MKKKSRRREKKALNKDKVKRFTCIVCPACCVVETDGDEVEGARCEKGEAFARQESIVPLRVLTTTVRCDGPTGARMLPVKTANPVPLREIPRLVRQIKAMRVSEIPPIGTALSLSFSGESITLLVTGELD